jgi:hypothetical protein
VNGFGFPRAWQVGSAHFLEDNLRGIMITLGDPSRQFFSCRLYAGTKEKAPVIWSFSISRTLISHRSQEGVFS